MRSLELEAVIEIVYAHTKTEGGFPGPSSPGRKTSMTVCPIYKLGVIGTFVLLSGGFGLGRWLSLGLGFLDSFGGFGGCGGWW
jgi:hypothetical protein